LVGCLKWIEPLIQKDLKIDEEEIDHYHIKKESFYLVRISKEDYIETKNIKD
jgi:hypothetical protein